MAKPSTKHSVKGKLPKRRLVRFRDRLFNNCPGCHRIRKNEPFLSDKDCSFFCSVPHCVKPGADGIAAKTYDPRYPLGKGWYDRFQEGCAKDREQLGFKTPETATLAAALKPFDDLANNAPGMRSFAKPGQTPPPPPKAPKIAFPVPQTGKFRGSTRFGCKVTALLRWMGANGFTVESAKSALPKLGLGDIKMPAEATIKAQIHDGVSGKHHHGPKPTLTKKHAEEIRGLLPAKPKMKEKPKLKKRVKFIEPLKKGKPKKSFKR